MTVRVDTRPRRSVIRPAIDPAVIAAALTNYIARCCEAFAHYSKGFAPEVPKSGLKKHERELAYAKRGGYLSPPIAWRVGGEFDPAFLYSPKFPAMFAIVMPRRGRGSTAVQIEDLVDRVRGGKTRAA